ncbi:GGDEF domain-containing protein [Roseomonas sp. E05]|uniref:GGDEF domain-containing protein n=1 Tax=Roseomonas sp. E05 TaxID=3046310 RepID=UPI0024BBE625|nr:GGDEF domain-containing protein [Roseomonas sp. E05]MDJ0386972.1 GGDEF domain-containing protein [Roseomonas sp. E05]
MSRLWKLVTAPEIKDRRDLVRYVFLATALSVAMALALDVANQLTFFLGWPAAFRSWIVTIGVALVIAVPILSWIGRAHLALYHAKQQVETLSRTDPLTSLPNRRALLERAEQSDVTLMVLVILDIDHFKKVNDIYGHRVGDAVLREVSRIMAASLKGLGMLARIGGEEFALVSSGVSPEDVIERLKALRRQVAAHPLLAAGQAVAVTISAGVAVRNSKTLDELYTEADRALYVAKHGGRNQIRLSDELRAMLGIEAPRSVA